MSNYAKITDFAAKDALAPGNPAKIITGTAHDNEFNAISTAIATKADAASPTFTGTVTIPTLIVSGLTATTVPYLDASKQLASSAVTPTELGYLTGVTSAIQTQLNLKAALAGPTFTGTTTVANFTCTGGDIYNYGYAGNVNQAVYRFAQGGGVYLAYLSGAFTLIGGALTQNGAFTAVGTITASGAAADIQSGRHVHTGAAGYVYSYGAVYAVGEVYAYYSDMRLKEKVAPLTGALDKLATLDTFTYRKSELGRALVPGADDVKVGISAQQVQAVQPEAVGLAAFDLGDDGKSKSGENYLTVQYERLVPLLIAGINELRAEVAALKAR